MDIFGQLMQGAMGIGQGGNDQPTIDVGGLAAQFGLSPEQANSAVGALLPAVLGGVHKAEEAGTLGNIADVANAMGAPHQDVAGGNTILCQIFGSKDVSRQVASSASAQTGISDTVLKAMLPIVAGLVAQQVAKKMGGGVMGGLAATLIASMLGSKVAASSAPAQQSGGGIADILGGLAGTFGQGGGANPLESILAGLSGAKR